MIDLNYWWNQIIFRAVYSCPHGFHVVGLQSRNCQADGQWAGQTPACKQNSKYTQIMH